MADIAESFIRGHQAGLAVLEHKQAQEERKLQQMVLRHQIERLKIEDQLQSRELQRQNLGMLTGQPAAEIPSETVTTPAANLPSRSLAGASTLPDLVGSLTRQRMASASGAPVEAPVTSTAAPGAQAEIPGTHPMTSRVARPIDIPGVPGLGVPGVSVRPRSLEQLVQAQIASEMAKPYTLNPGAVRKIGSDTIGEGGPRLQSVGAGGLAEVGPEGTVRSVVPGRQPVVRPVAGLLNGKRAFATPGPNSTFTIGTKDVTAQFRPAPSAGEVAAADREENRSYTRDHQLYADEIAKLSKQHADQMRAWSEKSKGAMPDEEVDPPEYNPPTFEEWRAQHGGSARKGKASTSKVQQPTDPLLAADPETGAVYRFPTKEAAAGYRKEKGIR